MRLASMGVDASHTIATHYEWTQTSFMQASVPQQSQLSAQVPSSGTQQTVVPSS